MIKVILLLCAAAISLPAQSLTTIVNFNGTNGAAPSGALLQAADGNFYGVTGGGGSGSGTIFRLTPDGNLTTIYNFNKRDGTSPGTGLIQGADGTFYGTTTLGGSGGGNFGYGTIFKFTPDGVLTTLHSFNKVDGYSPNAIILASDGNFYGTTRSGCSVGYGCVYKLTPSGTLTVLHAFTFQSDDGADPIGLVQASDGSFYGVTSSGGTHNVGTIFKLTPLGVTSTIYNFNGPDGKGPSGPLIVASDGNFYGVTYYGGANNNGTIFKSTPSGVLTTLYSLSATEGYGPISALLQAGDGNFYGVAEHGGSGGYGIVFKITQDGAFTTVNTFSGSNGSGFDLTSPLIQGSDGNIYGTTSQGGTRNLGTIFRVVVGGLSRPPTATTGFATSVTDSSAALSASISANGADTQAWFQYSTNSGMSGSISTTHQSIGSAVGAVPITASITRLNANTTYYFQAWVSNSRGTASGSIETFTTAGAAYYLISGTVLLSGVGLRGASIDITGSQLATTDSAGNYSVSVPSGGNYTVTPAAEGYTFIPSSLSFKNLNADQTASFIAIQTVPAAVLSTVASFNGSNGAAPRAGLIQAKDGNFYGTTSRGGANNLGTVFQVTPSGNVTTLHSFTGPDGANPGGGLFEAAGRLYGTTTAGGTANAGTVYSITPAGVFTSIESFGKDNNGYYPAGSLIQASDGDLYGATSGSDAFFPATVFRLTTSGTLTVFYTFASLLGSGPAAGLIQATDGNFYGTVRGSLQPGIIFKLTPSGSLTALYTLCTQSNCADGEAPAAPLAQGADGSLYGTTSLGGANGAGVIFKVTPAGEFTVLHSFSLADGTLPNGLLLASDGNFYGTTSGASAAGNGTIFRLTPDGTFITLHNFTTTDGAGPQGSLIQGADGALYGTTVNGGADGMGTVFRLPLPSSTPAIFPSSGVVSGASFQPGVAPNSWITILGTNLSTKTDTWGSAIVNGVLPPSLDGVSVSIGGKPAYIAYLSPGQINALAPDISPGNVTVTVTSSSGSTVPVTVAAQTFQPAFFMWGSYAVATRTDYSPAIKNGAFPGKTTVPAKPGETIILWGTGFGPATPPAPVGSVVPSGVLYNAANPVTVMIGDAAAPVLSAALTPGNAGLYQIAIQVPAVPADDDYPVIARVSGVQSPSNVLLTVRH